VNSTEAAKRVEIQWSTYAEYYDQMCEANPSYADMIDLVMSKVAIHMGRINPSILDVGAGTGNLLTTLTSVVPRAECIHLDINPSMNARARKKYEESGANVSIVQESALEVDFPAHTFDFILSTNAIYAIEPHAVLLAKLRKWIKTDGVLILVDFGRPQKVNDWFWYMLRENVRHRGLVPTFRLFSGNWEVAKQNRRTTAAQDQGNYWVHSTQEFAKALQQSGFFVEEIGSCYRGYSDIAVCKKIPR
jgi:ubiquinone/menaquinone biosynthesis C-methylase UbiE|tara:strand:+ start:5940 stop:6680 length:741 start_codon:yes stop_codon:yes gene_type:complete